MANEINILARFTFVERAEACQQALRANGFEVVQLDPITLDAEEPYPVAEWGRFGYQVDAIDDKWTLASAWDNATGLIFGEDWLLTAVVEASDAERARKLIRDYGGIL